MGDSLGTTTGLALLFAATEGRSQSAAFPGWRLLRTTHPRIRCPFRLSLDDALKNLDRDELASHGSHSVELKSRALERNDLGPELLIRSSAAVLCPSQVQLGPAWEVESKIARTHA